MKLVGVYVRKEDRVQGVFLCECPTPMPRTVTVPFLRRVKELLCPCINYFRGVRRRWMNLHIHTHTHTHTLTELV